MAGLKLFGGAARVSCRFYSTEKNVAFLGLGNMGRHMASNLIKKGFKVRGFDTSPETLKAATAVGVQGFPSIGECVKDAAYVVTALPNNEIVTEVYLGKDGICDHAKKGTLLMDTSTIEPAVSQKVAEGAKLKDLPFIDSPMSGGVMGAQKGTLAFMVGGSTENFDRAQPVLTAMGAKTVHCGPVGAGEIAKLCNNLLLAITMLGTSECLNMGVRAGLDPKALLTVINGSSGRSWTSEVYCPIPEIMPDVPSSKGYAGGFRLDLVVKDLNLATNLGTSTKSVTPLGAAATQMYRLMMTRGHGDKDFSYMYQFIKE